MPPTLPADTTQTRQTRHGAVLGTPAYMAPEQARGEVDRLDQRTDVYALGALLYFLLTLRPPQRGAAEGEPGAADRAPLPPRRLQRDIPRRLEAICLKALAAEPAARYQSAADLRADIGRYLADQSVTAYRESPAERVWRVLVHYRVAVLLVLMYLAMRVVFAIYQAAKGTPAES